MQKNVVLACGLGDLFVFLTRLDDFFLKNPEYTKIKFWTWLHTPALAKELVSLDKHSVSVFTLEDMEAYLRTVIPQDQIKEAEKFFIKQNRGGVGVDKYLEYISRFFPNLEQWVYLGVYEKYKTTFPYKLENVKQAIREKPYIIVHPFSTTVKTESPKRQWTPARWGHLMKMLRDYYKTHDIIVLGTNKDKIESVRDFPRGLVDLRGKTTLTEAVELIYGASAVAGTNSWVTLMALWANIPTYEQWFVQHQLMPSHHPKKIEELKHISIETLKDNEYPSTKEAWEKVRDLFDATIVV